MSAEQDQAAAGTAAEQGKAAPEGQQKGAPDQQQLQKSITAAKKVVETQKVAESLKERAMKAINPKERFKLLQEAYHKEVEAHGQSKYAKALSSGTIQGGMAGGGVGAGIAMGVGATLGAVVSGIVAVPTLLLGGLAGAGVGVIKGPFIKLGGGEKKEEKPMSDEQINAKAMKEAEALDQAVEKGATTVPQPPKPEEEEGSGVEDNTEMQESNPKKLAPRSVNEVQASPERKKPRKLEIRSGGQQRAVG